MILKLCKKHRVRVMRRGNLFHLVGRGVDLLVIDLTLVVPLDLTPAAA